MIKVKVCGMRDNGNIGEISASGADIIGFIFYDKSPRYAGNVSEETLTRNVPSGILKAGVFVNAPAEEVLNTCKRYRLEIAQLHGNETPDFCKQIKRGNLLVTKAFKVSENFSFSIMEKYSDVCDYYLFDSNTPGHGGSGIKFNWELIEKYPFHKPFFLGGGISPNDAVSLKNIQSNKLYAADINSCFETAPGIKDPLLVKNFIKTLKE